MTANATEIDLSSLMSEDMFTYSHSRAEGGENAGQNTWRAAVKRASTPPPILTDPEQFDAFRDWIADFGAWNEDEIAAWNDAECCALLLQFIAGDVREAGADSLEEMDWEQYETDASEGRISGRIFRADDGTAYYNISR